MFQSHAIVIIPAWRAPEIISTPRNRETHHEIMLCHANFLAMAQALPLLELKRPHSPCDMDKTSIL